MGPVALGLTFHGFLAPDLRLAACPSLFCSLAGAPERQLPCYPEVRLGCGPALLSGPPSASFVLFFLPLSPWEAVSGRKFLGYKGRVSVEVQTRRMNVL